MARALPIAVARWSLALVFLAGATSAAAQAAAPADTGSTPLTPEQLQSLVAPIALYPDALLAQTLVAATYPLELIQLQQWMAKHPDLKDKALADSVALQPWDPSIQSMAAVPDVVKRLADDIQWTTQLGNAFLAQQAAVMDAVQVMRKQARDKGALASSEQQTVKTETVESKTVIVVESSNPEVIYVPSYNPAYVYPPPIYPYPPIYYPPYTPGAAFVSFSFGFMMGAAIWGGSCCYAGWGGNHIYVNNNNHFNNININVNSGNRNQINTGGRGRGDTWQHNPTHRGGAPYGDRATSDRFGGTNRPGTAGGAATRPATGVTNRPATGTTNRAAGGAATRPATGGATRPATGATNRANPRPPTGSREQIGNRSVPSGGRPSGLSGGSRGYSGASARASSTRGASSFGGARGGMRGGGGGRRR